MLVDMITLNYFNHACFFLLFEALLCFNVVVIVTMYTTISC